MPPWGLRIKKTEEKGYNFVLPGDVMTTSKVNVMGKDINMFYNRLLNLGEIPRVTKAYIDANRAVIPVDIMQTDKVNVMTKKLDMNNFEILNLPHPTTLDSATSKRYVDENLTVLPADMVTRSVNLSFLSDLNMNNHRITNLRLPQEDTDAVSKKFFDDNTVNMMLTTKENDMQKPLNMNSHRIKELADPVDPRDSIHKTYANKIKTDSLSRMPVIGNEMRTRLDMNNHLIYNLPMDMKASPDSNALHAVNRKFLRDQFDNKLAGVIYQINPSIKDDFDFNNNKLLNLKDDDSASSGVTKKYVDGLVQNFPDMTNVMKTTKVNKMQQNIDMNQQQLLNLKEIPTVSKAYVDTNKYKLPPSVMKTTKINVMGADLDMNHHKLLNLTSLPESIKTYIDSETKFIYLDKTKSPSTTFSPFDGTAVDTSGIIARLENDNLFYSATLLPYVGFYSYYSDETEVPASPPNVNNHWLKIHKPLPRLRNSISFKEIKSHYCGVTYPGATQLFVELKPFLIYKLTANVFATKDGSEYYFKHTMPQSNSEIKIISNGRVNHQSTKAIAFGIREIAVGLHISLSSLTITHRTIEIEVLGAYKPGFF